MIRTALLAGIFLVLLSIAFGRSAPSLLLPAPKGDTARVKAPPPAPVKHIAKASESAPMPEPVREAAAPPPSVEPAPQAPVAPAGIEAPPAPPPAPAVAQDTPRTAGQPVSLLPPDMRPQTAAAEPVRAAPAALPETVQAAAPAPAAPPAITPAAEMPTIPVAARTAVAPYDVPSGSAHVDPGAKPADAPKFMTPQERSKELYRLAREMEDTFIHKLAR